MTTIECNDAIKCPYCGMDNSVDKVLVFMHSESISTTLVVNGCKYCGSMIDLTRLPRRSWYFDSNSNILKPFIDGLIYNSD